MVKFISSYSLYAYEDEMKRGFITMQGGHRIGVAGQVVMDGGKVLSLSNIYFLNIRVAREKRGCAKDIIPYLVHRNSIYNTLFVSPPGIGKSHLFKRCYQDFVKRFGQAGWNEDQHYR